MRKTPTRDQYARLRQTCVARGLRLTPQRDVLLRALSETMGHPTADELVRKVRKVLPTVSHATVYRNVQELVRAGLIGTLERSGAAVQFEVNPDHHHHFICRGCGQVWDVYLDRVEVTLNRRRSPLAGFRVDRRAVQLHGVCSRCRVKPASSAGARDGTRRAVRPATGGTTRMPPGRSSALAAAPARTIRERHR